MLRRVVMVVAVGLAGCGEPQPVELSFEGTLEETDPTHPDDGSFYDEYEFEAGAGFTIRVEMRSEDVDSYLFLYGPDDPVQDDDGMGEGYDALIVYEAENAGRWTVLANSSGPGDTGDYELTIVTAK